MAILVARVVCAEQTAAATFENLALSSKREQELPDQSNHIQEALDQL
jgi:hypothetical protein